MPKITLKGIIKKISPVSTIGDKLTKKQTLILEVAGFVDSYGEKIGKDEQWAVDLMGNKVDQFNLSAFPLENKKANVEVFLNSNLFVRDGQERHFINANLASLEIVNN